MTSTKSLFLCFCCRLTTDTEMSTVLCVWRQQENIIWSVLSGSCIYSHTSHHFLFLLSLERGKRSSECETFRKWPDGVCSGILTRKQHYDLHAHTQWDSNEAEQVNSHTSCLLTRQKTLQSIWPLTSACLDSAQLLWHFHLVLWLVCPLT